MIVVENTIISHDIITCHFACNLQVCKGACCIQGDAGAPLAKEEAALLHEILPDIAPYLRKKGIDTIRETGTSTIDSEGDTVTPLIDGKECAYALFENGIARCGIEKAYLAGAIEYRKPISCHLYPVRINKYKTYDAVNYDLWEICDSARTYGQKTKTPLYRFTEEALIRKYGKKWFRQLLMIANKLEKERKPI